ncbi:MAG: ABC transporter ATP-binding protein [Actinomycetota bacterium]
MPLLEVRDLRAGYGTVPALHGVTFSVDQGEIVAVLGPNGAGKTTTLSCISGLLNPWSGTVSFDGQDIGRMSPEQTVALGIAHVPEGRHVFPAMSVEDNLRLGSWAQRSKPKAAKESLDRVFRYFPVLADRRQQMAGSLSGGEQQMLAIGRALMSGPRLLIIDEAALGLAPVMVERVFEIVKEIRRDGNTVLLVEQNAPVTLALADRVYLMQRGKITTGGPAAEVREKGVLDAYLGPMAQAAKNLAKREEAEAGKPKKTGADLFTSSGGTAGAATKKRAGKKGR